jgi:hypothetical protein
MSARAPDAARALEALVRLFNHDEAGVFSFVNAADVLESELRCAAAIRTASAMANRPDIT